MESGQRVDRQAIHTELEHARTEFHALLDTATEAELAKPTDGTRWTNEQLLFHMLFGYFLMLPLLVLMRVFGRLPRWAGRGFARLLNAGTRPFDVVNYLGPLGGARVFGRRRMGAAFDRVSVWLHRRLDAESESGFALGMHYPARWDPFFHEFMTVADLYRYPTQHFDFHRRQLTLTAGD
ncbi:DinB family protein [Streptomyces sp. NBC_00827]|uniref:DinB family protein n=1 Tax=Streptomyces sp. NBC_00827 TaxID=2903677 RepID=UPI003865CF72|nr:DinB family protein [Streptomyces sp. NBC_00827]